VGIAPEYGSGCQPIRELAVAISVSGCEAGREHENAEWECTVWVYAVCECGWGGQKKRFSSEFIEKSSICHRCFFIGVKKHYKTNGLKLNV
jgi:hypothetical protein